MNRLVSVEITQNACLAMLTAALVALAGCATVNPFYRGRIKVPQVKVDYAGDLKDAINYARDWQLRYLKNAGQDAIIRNSAVLAIPLAGAALFRASTGGADSHAVIGLGIGGATLYGMANSLSNTQRQRIYMAGSVTLSCAIDAMYPYVMEKAEHDELKNNLIELQRRVTSVSNSVVALRTAIVADKTDAAGPDFDLIALGESAMTAGNSTLDRAKKILSDGYLLSMRASTAGMRLTTAVDKIVSTVGDQLALTQVDLQSLAGIVSNLGATAASFRPTVPSIAAAPTGKAAGFTPQAGEIANKFASSLVSATSALTNSLDGLVDAAELVAAAVNASAAAADEVTNAGNPGACELAQINAGFRVDPDTASITIAAGQSRKFVTSGGVGLPRGTVVGDAAAAGARLTPGQNDGSFTLETTAEAKGGDVELVFTDGTGHNRKVIAVTVGPALVPAPITSPGKDDTDKKPTLPPDPGLSKDDLKKIQKALNAAGSTLREDGDWGQQTSDALRDFQKRNNLTQTGTPSPETLFKLNVTVSRPATPSSAPPGGGNTPGNGANTAAAIDSARVAGAKNNFERSLTAQQVGEIRTAFGLASGGLDQALRAKISAFRPATAIEDRANVPADQLTPGLVTAILATNR